VDTRDRPCRRFPQQHIAFCYSSPRREETRMSEQPKPEPQQLQIKADEKELQGMYSNLVMIHHNAEEFTLNFIYVFPNAPQGKLVASMILSPGHAKRLLRALAENIGRYEAQFGAIPETPGGATEPKVGFVH
jgi:hypothetical protein